MQNDSKLVFLQQVPCAMPAWNLFTCKIRQKIRYSVLFSLKPALGVGIGLANYIFVENVLIK